MTAYPDAVLGVDPVAERGAPAAAPSVALADRTAHLADRSLLVVADPHIGDAVAAAYADAPTAVHVARRPATAASVGAAAIRDALSSYGPVDGVLLAVPADADLAALPGPLVDGVPVGVIRADDPAGIDAWRSAVEPPIRHAPAWAVLAMATDEFLEPAGDLAASLQHGLADAVATGPAPEPDTAREVQVRDWRADRVDRPALCRRLATGPSLAVYLGHGRPTGWVGYQALRWRHVTAVTHRAPIGALVALACDALGRDASAAPAAAPGQTATSGQPDARRPFLERFVRAGRAAAAVGPLGAVQTADLEDLSTVFAAALADDAPATIGDLLRAADRRITDASLDRHLAAYRLVGSPVHPIR